MLEAAPPLHEQLFASLRRALMGGQFLPGERINVRDVAKELGTSPMPVRDALRRLEAVGAVVIEAKKMPVVATLTVEEYAQVVEMRRLLETRATRIACRLATKQQIVALKDLNREILERWRQGDRHRAMNANSAFHLYLYSLANEPLVLASIENLWLRSGPYLQLAVQAAVMAEDAGEHVFDAHRQLIGAIEARQAVQAAKALERDIAEGVEAYRAAITHATAQRSSRRAVAAVPERK